MLKAALANWEWIKKPPWCNSAHHFLAKFATHPQLSKPESLWSQKWKIPPMSCYSDTWQVQSGECHTSHHFTSCPEVNTLDGPKLLPFYSERLCFSASVSSCSLMSHRICFLQSGMPQLSKQSAARQTSLASGLTFQLRTFLSYHAFQRYQPQWPSGIYWPWKSNYLTKEHPAARRVIL